MIVSSLNQDIEDDYEEYLKKSFSENSEKEEGKDG